MMLAVIPARGGSKRIPRKNIKLFCGKPIIAWSIEAALDCGCFDQVIVSTDDAEIADIAQQYGARVPFIRPVELSDDYTGTIPVISHAIEWFRERYKLPDQVCCIYATAPFVRASDIRNGLDILRSADCDFAFSVTSYPFPIQRAVRITGEGRVEMLNPECFNIRSQDLEDVYHDAGQFYWGKASAWLTGKTIFGLASAVVQLPRYHAQDIDTIEDWEMAEYLFHAVNLKSL
jgi:pseudaminic acid cytidylyltransferase